MPLRFDTSCKEIPRFSRIRVNASAYFRLLSSKMPISLPLFHFSIFGSANSVSGALFHFWPYPFCYVCSNLYLRIGAHPGAAQPYLASPPPPPPTIDYMMYGVCDMVSYLNNFFTEEKQMERIYVSIPETPHITHFTSPQFPCGTVLVNTAASGKPPRVGRLGWLPPVVAEQIRGLRGIQQRQEKHAQNLKHFDMPEQDTFLRR